MGGVYDTLVLDTVREAATPLKERAQTTTR